eukprot:1058493_1
MAGYESDIKSRSMLVEKDTRSKSDIIGSDLTHSNVSTYQEPICPYHCNIHIILQCITISLRQHTLVIETMRLAHEKYATYLAPPTTYHDVRRYLSAIHVHVKQNDSHDLVRIFQWWRVIGNLN